MSFLIFKSTNYFHPYPITIFLCTSLVVLSSIENTILVSLKLISLEARETWLADLHTHSTLIFDFISGSKDFTIQEYFLGKTLYWTGRVALLSYFNSIYVRHDFWTEVKCQIKAILS